MYYLGVDGGGTKTAFSLMDEKFNLVENVSMDTCHYRQKSFDGFEKIIREGIKEILNNYGITKEEIAYAYFGIPGYGENEEDTISLHKITENIMESEKFTCGNDVEACWAGSLGCKPGISIIAGTGSIAYGIDNYENRMRSGGWGYFCGDEGSAYWIAKKAIRVFCKQSDGRVEKTALYYLMRNKLNLKYDFDIIDFIVDKTEFKRDKIAQLSKLVYEAARKNDLNALNIFEQAAYEQFLMIRAVLEKLNFYENEEVLVSYGGGVFKSGEYVIKPLKEKLTQYNKNIKFMNPLFEPVVGSCLYAYKLAGNEINYDVINKLKNA